MNHSIVLFDGVCNYCNSVVNQLIRHDREGVLRFAALQSSGGQQLLQKHGLPLQYFDSFILIDGGKVYKKSSAAIRLYNKLGWQWKWTQLFKIVPLFIRDGIYDYFAKHRYYWFGRKDECMIPTADVRSRFLE